MHGVTCAGGATFWTPERVLNTVPGSHASLRQFFRFARPWQRALLGVVVALFGVLIQSGAVSALGVVIVGLAIIGAFRGRQSDPEDMSRMEKPEDAGKP